MHLLFDKNSYEIIEIPKVATDPLKFRDIKRYPERLKEARATTSVDEALRVAFGQMNGNTVVVAVFDFSFMGGSMGLAVGEGLLTAARLAISRRSPLVVIPSSGGARMQEGIYSLMQMARTAIAVDEVKEAGLPYIVVLTDPTTGGVTASFAMLGDISIAEPGSVIGFAGQRVIEQTIRETLPDGFQRAEYLLEHGMVDMVVPRDALRDTLIRVVDLLMNKNSNALGQSQRSSSVDSRVAWKPRESESERPALSSPPDVELVQSKPKVSEEAPLKTSVVEPELDKKFQ